MRHPASGFIYILNWWKKSNLPLKYTNMMIDILFINNEELIELLKKNFNNEELIKLLKS